MANNKVHSLERTQRCSGLHAVAVVAQVLSGGWRSQATAIRIKYRHKNQRREDWRTVSSEVAKVARPFRNMRCLYRESNSPHIFL